MRPSLILLAMTFASILPAQQQQEPIECKSEGAAHTCTADTFYGVLLAQEYSSHLCVQGKTWQYDAEGITVSKGCSAQFLVNPRRSNAFGNGGYKVYGTGEHAFHTNGNVKPGVAAPNSTPWVEPQPTPVIPK